MNLLERNVHENAEKPVWGGSWTLEAEDEDESIWGGYKGPVKGREDVWGSGYNDSSVWGG